MAAVALPDRKVTLEAPEGPLVLALDRNTLVFLAARLGTVQDLAAGQAVRAGVGPKGEAFWIEVLPQGAIPEASPAPTPAATPGPAPAPGATSPPAAAPLPPPAPGSAPGAAPTLAPNR
jgi:hypothetical protein